MMETGSLFRVTNEEYTYEVIRNVICIEEYGEAKVYGIRIYNEDKSEYADVEDISDDFEEIKRLCAILCEENACPVHLMDIAEDFINS